MQRAEIGTPVNVGAITWPIAGVKVFMTHPRLWFWPLLCTLGILLTMLTVLIGVTWWTLPRADADLAWWAWVYRVPLSLLWGVLTAAVLWLIGLPVLLGLAFDSLAQRVLRMQGVTPQGETVMRGLGSALYILVRSLGWRLLWPAAGLVSGLVFPPLGMLVTTIGLGHVTLIDALDVALAARGVGGPTRYRLINAHRQELIAAGAVAGGLSLVMGTTLVLWLFWLPSCMTAGALRAARMEVDGLPRYDDADDSNAVDHAAS